MSGHREDMSAIEQLSSNGAYVGLIIDAWTSTSRKNIYGVIIASCNVWTCYDTRLSGLRHDAIAVSQFVEGLLKVSEASIYLPHISTDTYFRSLPNVVFLWDHSAVIVMLQWRERGESLPGGILNSFGHHAMLT